MPQKAWQKKIAERDYAAHTKRIAEMKSSLDISQPKTYTKSKKKDVERKRHYAEIDRENRLLLERLAKIMQQKTIDNESGVLQFKKSLTQTNRRIELERITDENQRLLRRIQEAEPCYNHLQWEEAAKTREVYLRNMTEFPETFEENRRRLMAASRHSADSLESSEREPRRHGLLRPLSGSR
eukprot:CAMPEP_0182420840 /NCGR_PEP_ID=MMETSP1167-20130531/5928_1 /TAXON_ID=2988 /ORGANISM="Mallomonas Sp, Strain CCMP3275" /LENGTH=181 /DNA_ID=CAMNT_0024597337 /DNA_START=193 /DNA_END=738 /DNA_ORIENTATION=-